MCLGAEGESWAPDAARFCVVGTHAFSGERVHGLHELPKVSGLLQKGKHHWSNHHHLTNHLTKECCRKVPEEYSGGVGHRGVQGLNASRPHTFSNVW